MNARVFLSPSFIVALRHCGLNSRPLCHKSLIMCHRRRIISHSKPLQFNVSCGHISLVDIGAHWLSKRGPRTIKCQIIYPENGGYLNRNSGSHFQQPSPPAKHGLSSLDFSQRFSTWPGNKVFLCIFTVSMHDISTEMRTYFRLKENKGKCCTHASCKLEHVKLTSTRNPNPGFPYAPSARVSEAPHSTAVSRATRAARSRENYKLLIMYIHYNGNE